MSTFSRAAWGAPTPAGGAQLVGPLQGIAIHHTAARIPMTPDAARVEVRTIYNEHTSPSSSDPTKPWSDIGYSWLVDAWGNIYEGRGWLRSGAHTPGYNGKVHAIAYIGWGREPIPAAALAAMAQCVTDGQRVGAVVMRPTFMGHRDALSTECPGDALYAQIAQLEAIVNDGDLGPAVTPPPQPPSGEEDDTMPTHLLRLPSGAVVAAFASGVVRTIGGAEFGLFRGKGIEMLNVTDPNEATQLTWQAHPMALDVRRIADATVPAPRIVA